MEKIDFGPFALKNVMFRMSKEIKKPWGSHETLHEDKHCKIKKITINPNSRISLQRHKKRDENWTVLSGNGILELTWETHMNFSTYEMKNGVSYSIPCGCVHRATNNSDEPLVFIEVQTGGDFDENDIIRFEDDYGREINGKIKTEVKKNESTETFHPYCGINESDKGGGI